jgi:hypothetical protein
MQRKRVSVGIILVASLATTGLAIAANAHFITATAARTGDNVTVTFKEAGLGNTQTVTVQASAQTTASYACFNNGGKNPSAENKRSVQSLVSASGNFTADKNGSISGTLTLTPPDPNFSCPGGQTLVRLSLTYTNVTITDQTSNASKSIPGTF